MQDIFFWLMVLGFIGWLGLRRRNQAANQAAQEPDNGPEQLQGYRSIDASLTPHDLRAAPSDGAWSLLSIEDLPTQHRRRLVMQVQVAPASPLPAIEALLWRLAGRVQRWASAHVVVIEAFFPAPLPAIPRQTPSISPARLAGSGVLRLLLSIDGAGWTGQQSILACIEGPSLPPRSLGLAEVQRLLLGLPASPPTLDASASSG